MRRITRNCICLFLLAIILLLPVSVFASDISGALYWAGIQVSNNSTATTNVAVPITGTNTTNFQAGNYLNAAANNCVMRSSSGADVKFMPGYTPSAYPWNCWVPSIGDTSLRTNILYFAESTGGHIRYFPAAGGMAVSDNATIELSDNFTIEQKGWVDTDAGADKDLIDKPAAFKTFVSPTVSGNITSVIYPTPSNTTLTIRPNAEGDYTNITSSTGGTHWGVVDEAIVDDNDYVSQTTEAYLKDAYELGVPGWLGIEVTAINSVTIYYRVFCATNDGNATPYLRLDGVETTGTEVAVTNAFVTHNEALARPGGGTWTIGDIADLQAAVGIKTGTADNMVRLSWVYVVVDYDYVSSYTAVTATGVSSGEMTVKTTQVDNTGAGWLGTWSNRIRIDIDADKVDANVTHFPVMIYLSSSAGIGSDDVTAVFDEVGANHLKIAITQADGTTENYVEVEKWDNGAEEAWLWTSIAGWTIDNATDTTMYLYYDNSHADNVARVGVPNDAVVQSVWDGNFQDVDHMKDGASNASTYDSTSNNNDGTKKGANEPIEAAGMVGDAQDFDGVNDYVDVPDNFQTATGSVEVLFKVDTDEVDQVQLFSISRNADAVTTQFSVALEQRNDILARGVLASVYVDGVRQWQIDVPKSIYDPKTDFNYHHVEVSQDGVEPVLYLDGVAVGTFFTDLDKTVWLDDLYAAVSVADTCTIGSRKTDGTYSGLFSGKIDEVRVSDTCRLESWVDASYDTAWDDFVDYIPNAEGYLVDYSLDFKIYVDSVLKDRTLGASVPDNANDWAFVENGSMMYMEYTDIDIGGVPTASWDWEYGLTFIDSISGIVATPTFRTASSDADVSANLTSFQAVAEATAPAYALEEGPDFIDPAMTGNITGGFTTTPPAGTFPLAGVITAVANATGTPPQLPLLMLAIFVILSLSLTFSWIARKYGSGPILIKIILIAGIMGIFVGIGNFGIDFWMVLAFLMIAPTWAIASKHGSWS